MALKLVRKKKATPVSRRKSEITKFMDAIDVQLRLATGAKVKKGRGSAKSWMQDGADYDTAKVLIPRVGNRPLYRDSAIVVNMKQKAPPTSELKDLKKRVASGKLSNRIYATSGKRKKAAKKK